MKKYFIIYDIPVLEHTDIKVGPYSKDDLEFHLIDISGFEGIENIRIIGE